MSEIVSLSPRIRQMSAAKRKTLVKFSELIII